MITPKLVIDNEFEMISIRITAIRTRRTKLSVVALNASTAPRSIKL